MYAALASAVVAISFSAIFIRLCQAPAMTIASNRMLAAVLLLLPATLWLDRHHLQGWTRSQVLYAAASGAFLAVHFGLWTVSLDYTSVASSVVFVTTHPIVVAVLGFVWLREPLSRETLIGIGLTMLGSLLIGLNDLRVGGQALWGDVLAVGAAAALVGYLLIGRRLRRNLGSLSYSLVVYAACWAGLLAASLLGGVQPWAFPAQDLPLYLALAAVCTLGGHTVFNWALRHVSAAVVAVAFVAEPAGAAILAWALLGEGMSLLTVGGGSLILVGVALAARSG
jgi:drug/metabolite transporter (DMT)-like permease